MPPFDRSIGHELFNLLQGMVSPIIDSFGSRLQKTADGYRQETRFTVGFLCSKKEAAFHQLVKDYDDIAAQDVVVEIDAGPLPADPFAFSCPYVDLWSVA